MEDMPRLRLRAARAALDAAPTLAAWREAAEQLDALTGMDAWRADDASPHYDAATLRSGLERLRALRAAGDVDGLARALHALLHRHEVELTEPALYQAALGGTKHLIDAVLDEAEAAIASLREAPVPDAVKAAGFGRAAHAVGRSALMLSGGATLGFFHLGVVKALLQANLLPEVLSGSSTGAMIAAGVACRTDAELRELFEHPDRMERRGLVPLPLREMWSRRSVLSSEALHATLRANIGDYTFEEAHARSGRVLNISVSPTHRRQKPRLLSHLTSPTVLVPSAVLASSALPGLFPPVTLYAREGGGAATPWLPEERWIDGSMLGDLPMMRVSRLHNVNHFIVSQTNPHVIPFVAAPGGGPLSTVFGLGTRVFRNQTVQTLGAARTLARATPLRPLLDLAHGLADQDYTGHVSILPPFDPRLYARIVSNPSLELLNRFILDGQRATWPWLPLIRNRTRVSRALHEALRRVRSG